MKLKKIGLFLKRSKIPVDIEDDKEYKRVTIRINHNGVSLRDTEIGKRIGTKKQFILKSGQFILSKIDARYGAFGIAPVEVDNTIITGNFWAYDVNQNLLNIEWFNQFTSSKDFYNLCENASSGITHRKYLDEKFFLNYEINLPLIEEQLQQIEKIKVLKIKFDSITAELNNQRDLVKKLKQQLLNDAVQGKLVPQNFNDEPASALLARIKTEKAQSGKKEKPLPPITKTEIPFKIPENWVWCKLGEIAEIVRGGSPRPAGDPQFYGGNIPFLKVGDLTGYEEIYLNSHTHSIKEAGLIKTRLVEANTLMLTNSGATLGIPRICSFSTTFNDGIAAFLNLNYIDKVYLYFFLKSRSSWFLSEASRGQGQPNLNTDIIGATLFPLPPLSEQTRIVEKLNQLMQLCDGLEKQIEQSIQWNAQLLQQVLREALKSEK